MSMLCPLVSVDAVEHVERVQVASDLDRGAGEQGIEGDPVHGLGHGLGGRPRLGLGSARAGDTIVSGPDRSAVW